MLDALAAPADALVVMDAGIATEANIAWLRDNRLPLPGGQPGTHPPLRSRAGAGHRSPARGAPSMSTRSSIPDSAEVRLYCYSEARAKKERGIAGPLRRALRGRAAQARRRAQATAHPQAARPGLAAHRPDQGEEPRRRRPITTVDVIADDSGTKAHAVTWKRRPLAGTMVTHPGVYCLRTNLDDWDEETLWRTYTSLTDVEAVFRSLKSELGLRPIFHQTQRRSDGHLFITVDRLPAGARPSADASPKTANTKAGPVLRRALEGQQRVTATFRRKDGRTFTCARRPVPSPGNSKSIARSAPIPLQAASGK